MSVYMNELQVLFQEMELGAYLQSEEGSMLEVNPAALTIHGVSREEFLASTAASPGLRMLGESGEEIPRDRQPAALALQNAKKVRDFIAAIKAEGREEAVWVKINAIPLAEGTVLVTLKDISELKRLQQVARSLEAEKERKKLKSQIFQAQKLESLGALAGGIAHDFNNILTSIMGNTELALLQLAPGTPACDNLRRVEKASRRAADLIKQMLAYTGKGESCAELIDMNKLVEELAHMLEAVISKKATLRLYLARPLRLIHADPVQMRQIVMNLVLNASEALGHEVGKISVSTAQAYYDEEELKEFRGTDGLAPGFYLTVSVSDTGYGMDKQSRERFFAPLFSTKVTGRGLGIAAVMGIVKAHKGGMKVNSDLGKGSTFTVLLPAREDILAGSKPAEPASAPLGKGMVLLVDDEEEVCELVGQMLNRLGYEVVTARDGHEALEVYLQRDDVAFVILDFTMPVMDGEQTYKQLRDIDPEVKVVITSGYSDYEIAKRFEGKGVKGVLQKPFDMAALRKVIG